MFARFTFFLNVDHCRVPVPRPKVKDERHQRIELPLPRYRPSVGPGQMRSRHSQQFLGVLFPGAPGHRVRCEAAPLWMQVQPRADGAWQIVGAQAAEVIGMLLRHFPEAGRSRAKTGNL